MMNVQSRQWLTVLTAVFLVFSASPSSAQKKPTTAAPIGLPQDWSHRHVVYSNPDTPEEAAKKGQTAKWRKNYRDPRFVLALSRKIERQETDRYAPRLQAKNSIPVKPRELIEQEAGLISRPKPVRRVLESGMHRDWSQVLGGSGGVGTPGVYPAKYSFDIFATPSCANDFVVYSTGTAGSTAIASPVAADFERRTLTFNGNPGNGATVTIGTVGTARTIVLTASGTVNTGQNFLNAGGNTGRAINLAAAANRWSHQTGITASASAAVVTFSQNTTGDIATVSLAKTEDGGPEDMVLGGGNAGTNPAGQPTIVAFNQLYATCNNDDPKQPRVRWSYNTALTGQTAIVETSPVLSYFGVDGSGKQVAFVQRRTDSAPDVLQLVLLKWGTTLTGTIGAPTRPPTAASAADYRNNTGACSGTAGCMLVLPFSGTSTADVATVSSPYVDYSGDVLWVGDGVGNLHKFTGVFSGIPAEVTAGGFPVTVSAGNKLSSPVYDGNTGMVFVGSGSNTANATAGRLHRVNSGSGTFVSSGQLARDGSLGVLASPILDPSAARAYVFVYSGVGNAGAGANCTETNCRAVFQFDTAFTAAATGNKAYIGGGNNLVGEQYIGTFDDAYYSSPTPDGALYVAGGSPANRLIAVLWKIPIVSNVMGTPIQGATISGIDTTAGSYSSPLSEVKNGVNDYLYVGVHDFASDGTATVCGTGAVGSACIYMFNLSDLNGTVAGTGDPWGTANVPFAGLSVFGGTGGIIMDNISVDPDKSQIYFSNLSSPGNAYQAAQDDLN